MKIYLDTGDWQLMAHFHDVVAGFTTNPSLLKSARIDDYRSFAMLALRIAKDRPISLEVFADDMETMEQQARVISSWGPNVYVKIPITNTEGKPMASLIRNLGADGIKVNVTAVFTFDQINLISRVIWPETPAILSIFAGRIADTGRDPVPFITKALNAKHANTKVLWASTREILNIAQAQAAGCDIITITPELAKKLHLRGKDLNDYSLETVKQFHDDAEGLKL